MIFGAQEALLVTVIFCLALVRHLNFSHSLCSIDFAMNISLPVTDHWQSSWFFAYLPSPMTFAEMVKSLNCP